MKISDRIITIFLLCLIHIFCFSQDVYYKQYTLADGLPSMTTYEMVQDSNGIFWIGTEKGLVSFNGEKFITYTHPDLLDNDIIELEINKDGDVIFLNLSHQLGKVVDGKIQIVLSLSGVQNELVSTKTKDFVISIELENELKTHRYYELDNGRLKIYDEQITQSYETKNSAIHPINVMYFF